MFVTRGAPGQSEGQRAYEEGRVPCVEEPIDEKREAASGKERRSTEGNSLQNCKNGCLEDNKIDCLEKRKIGLDYRTFQNIYVWNFQKYKNSQLNKLNMFHMVEHLHVYQISLCPMSKQCYHSQ